MAAVSRQSSFEDFASTPGEKAVAEAIAGDDDDPDPDPDDDGGGGGNGGGGGGDEVPPPPPSGWERAVEYVREFYDDSYDARTKLGSDLRRWADHTDVDAPDAVAGESVLQPLIRYQKQSPKQVWDAITQVVNRADARTIGKLIVDFALEKRARDDDRTLTLREEAQVRSHAENNRLDRVLSVVLNDARTAETLAEVFEHPRELLAYYYGDEHYSFTDLSGVGEAADRRLTAALKPLVGVYGKPGTPKWNLSEQQYRDDLDAAASGRRQVPIIVVATTSTPQYYVIEEDDPNAGGALTMGVQDDLNRVLRNVIGPASQFETDARIGTATVEWARAASDRELVDVSLERDIQVEQLPDGVANAQESWFEAARRSATQYDSLRDLLSAMGGMAQMTGAMPSWVFDVRDTLDQLDALYEPGVQSFGTVETPDDFDCATREMFVGVVAYALYRLEVDPGADDADTQYRDRLADTAADVFDRLADSLYGARCDVAVSRQAYDAAVQDLVLALRNGDVDHRPPAGWLTKQFGDGVSPAKGGDYEPGDQQAAAPSTDDVDDVLDALGDGWNLVAQSADRLRFENVDSDLPADAVIITNTDRGWDAEYERGSQRFDGTSQFYDRPTQAADAVADWLRQRQGERSVDRAYTSLSGTPETTIPVVVGKFALSDYGFESWTYTGRQYGRNMDGTQSDKTIRPEMTLSRADPSDDFADESRGWHVQVPTTAREFDSQPFDRLDAALAYLSEVATEMSGRMQEVSIDARNRARDVAIEGVIDRLDGGLPTRMNGWERKDRSLFRTPRDYCYYVGGEWETPSPHAKHDRLRNLLLVKAVTRATERGGYDYKWQIGVKHVDADDIRDSTMTSSVKRWFDTPEEAVSALLDLLEAVPARDEPMRRDEFGAALPGGDDA